MLFSMIQQQQLKQIKQKNLKKIEKNRITQYFYIREIFSLIKEQVMEDTSFCFVCV